MNSNGLTQRVNSYFAILLITIFGAGAALIIIHVANQSEYAVILPNGEVNYASLN